ncbi:hypothetical protein C8034_v002593 [Colletotrichum sidae]|uniref:Uncharacterized protein n=1 Tax=Colletotrichum sidae TaxID=1347389 RepID=A0A4R8TBN3_9PEZI|nr:hypothetical protein C8034_v002593 [Colletotrichum sidae]
MSAVLGAERTGVNAYPTPYGPTSPATSPRPSRPRAPSLPRRFWWKAIRGASWKMPSPLRTITPLTAFSSPISIAWYLRDSAEARCWFVAGFHTGRPMMRASVEEASLTDAGSEVQRIWELDCDGEEREWMWDRGIEDVIVRKRWLIVGILKRKIAGNENGA